MTRSSGSAGDGECSTLSLVHELHRGIWLLWRPCASGGAGGGTHEEARADCVRGCSM